MVTCGLLGHGRLHGENAKCLPNEMLILVSMSRVGGGAYNIPETAGTNSNGWAGELSKSQGH